MAFRDGMRTNTESHRVGGGGNMKIKVNGKSLFFDVEGDVLHTDGSTLMEKPTLILLHGSPGNSDHTVFKPMFSELSDVAQIVYLDLAGSGRSDDPADGVFSLEAWADDLVGFCDALGIVKPIVLGNSAGGMVAGVYGARYPGHAGKIILSSTHAKLDTTRCLEMFERLGGPDVRAVAERALVTHGDAESLNEYVAKCMTLYNPTPQTRTRHCIFRYNCAIEFHRIGGVWHRMDFRDQLDRIDSPVMIMVGDLDPVTPVQDSEDLRRGIKAELVRFERFTNAGHSVWLDEPERAFRVIREFVLS